MTRDERFDLLLRQLAFVKNSSVPDVGRPSADTIDSLLKKYDKHLVVGDLDGNIEYVTTLVGEFCEQASVEEIALLTAYMYYQAGRCIFALDECDFIVQPLHYIHAMEDVARQADVHSSTALASATLWLMATTDSPQFTPAQEELDVLQDLCEEDPEVALRFAQAMILYYNSPRPIEIVKDIIPTDKIMCYAITCKPSIPDVLDSCRYGAKAVISSYRAVITSYAKELSGLDEIDAQNRLCGLLGPELFKEVILKLNVQDIFTKEE